MEKINENVMTIKNFLKSKVKIRREHIEMLSRVSIIFIIHTIAEIIFAIIFPIILLIINVTVFSSSWFYFIFDFFIIALIATQLPLYGLIIYNIIKEKRVNDFERSQLCWVRILLLISIVLKMILHFAIYINLKYGSRCNQQYIIDFPCIISYIFKFPDVKMVFWGLTHLFNIITLIIFILLNIIYLIWLNIYNVDNGDNGDNNYNKIKETEAITSNSSLVDPTSQEELNKVKIITASNDDHAPLNNDPYSTEFASINVPTYGNTIQDMGNNKE